MTPLDTWRGHSQTARPQLFGHSDTEVVIQLPSAHIEAVRTMVRAINIRFSFYIGTHWVRLNFLLKIELELELEQTSNDYAMF